MLFPFFSGIIMKLQPTRRLIWTLRILMLGIALYLGYSSLANWHSSASVPTYKLAQVDRGNIVSVVSATGTVSPVSTVIVGSQLSGQITEILADWNDKVKAGQVVARLNSDQINAKLDLARAELLQVKALLQENEVAIKEAKEALRRQSSLVVSGATSVVNRDTAQMKVDSLQAKREGIIAQLEQKQAIIRQIEVDLRNSEIRSPVDGIIIQRNVEIGQTVAATYQAPTLFQIADDLRHMEIWANVDETDVARIKPGQFVKFSVSAYRNREFEGRVKLTRLGSTNVSNVVVYTVVVSFENLTMELMPGMTTQLKIMTDQRDNVNRIPNTALRWKAGGPFTLVNGKPMKIDAQLGITDGTVTEIVGYSGSVIIGGPRS
jgi:HlyD family secretion protein